MSVLVTVHRLLGKHGCLDCPNQKHRAHRLRWQRYEKPQPGHRLQVDVKFLERIPGSRKRLYQFTAIDDCTRIRVLKIFDACNQDTAIRFIDDVMRRLPFRVHVVQTDNGAEFQSRFHWHLESRDVRHVYIRPRTPRLNGKVERSHRVDDQEFYQLLDQDGVRDDIHLFNEKLREWEDYYNTMTHGAWTARPVRTVMAKRELGVPRPSTLQSDFVARTGCFRQSFAHRSFSTCRSSNPRIIAMITLPVLLNVRPGPPSAVSSVAMRSTLRSVPGNNVWGGVGMAPAVSVPCLSRADSQRPRGRVCAIISGRTIEVSRPAPATRLW